MKDFGRNQTSLSCGFRFVHDDNFAEKAYPDCPSYDWLPVQCWRKTSVGANSEPDQKKIGLPFDFGKPVEEFVKPSQHKNGKTKSKTRQEKNRFVVCFGGRRQT